MKDLFGGTSPWFLCGLQQYEFSWLEVEKVLTSKYSPNTYILMVRAEKTAEMQPRNRTPHRVWVRPHKGHEVFHFHLFPSGVPLPHPLHPRPPITCFLSLFTTSRNPHLRTTVPPLDMSEQHALQKTCILFQVYSMTFGLIRVSPGLAFFL